MGMPDRLEEGEKGAAVLYSGGMDSTVVVAALLKEGYKVYPIAMDDGSLNYNMRRKVAIEMSLQKLGILNRLIEQRIPNPEPLRIDRTSFGFVSGYKLIMIMAAMSVCQILNIDELHLGYNADNSRGGYLDEGEEFMQRLSQLYYDIYSMERNTEHFFGKKIKVINTFFSAEKYEMVKKGVELGVDFSLTISCRQVQAGGGLVHCGNCEVCRRRRESFICAEVNDPTLWSPGSKCAINVQHETSTSVLDRLLVKRTLGSERKITLQKHLNALFA